ncbi:MAG: hypothetical protein V3R66_02660 [Rhodospirillales bacterium]
MSRLLSWIILAPLALMVISFSVSNRDAIVLSLWPLETSSPPVPVFGVVLVSIFCGILIGLIILGVSSGGMRRRANLLKLRSEKAEREVEKLQEEIDDLHSAAKNEAQGALPPPSGAKAA